MPKEKVTTNEHFQINEMIIEHIQTSKEKYCEKLPKTKEKQNWQHSKIDFQTNTYALFDDFYRWTFDPGGQTLTKQEAAIRDQVCRSEDRSSQGGDDGHHPATFIGFEDESFSRGSG